MKKIPRILCIGMPVRDLVFRVDDVPARGHKKRAAHFSEITGGNAINAAIAIARLGGRILLAGPMGDADEKAGDGMLDDLVKEGIDCSGLVRMPGLTTPISNVMIDAGGERTIVTYRDPALWNVRLPPTDVLLDDCDAILVESRCAGFATSICIVARNRSIPVILDGDQKMSMQEEMLLHSSHIIFSAEALHATSGVTDNVEAMQKIALLTPSLLAVTSGAQGTTWLDERRNPQHAPAFLIDAVDTLGAGDVFHGAFALAIAEGQPLGEAMRFASAAAALKCTGFGGAFASPRRMDVETLLGAPVFDRV